MHLQLDGGRGHVWRHGQIVPSDAALMPQMRFDRVYSQGDLPGLENRRLPLRALKCAAGPAGYAVLAVQRAGKEFRAVDGLQLSDLSPHLGQALSVWRDLMRERAQATLDRQIASDLGGGWVILGPAGNVQDIAPQVAMLLAELPGVTLGPNGWIEFADPGIAQDFRHAVTMAQEGREPPVPVTLSRDPSAEMILSSRILAEEQVLVGLIRHLRQGRSLSVERVAAHFDISRSEARLAILLCDGLSLQDAAAELGWTIETARSGSKRIFARMGISGQPAILRRVLTSAVWLG
ncbi:hypothetical protein [Paracoccus sp. PAR01]|uniref:helix-turn-helix transcriptional regulator n=1 Tax=Paracoccus sp. PAR01 TaxID=2769282 RepID=UPI00177B1449|nr:hypothetical protein [Paracoccus sp. PAR01]MBD9527259.1 hypothetical protein [Paracoccus sp. PAR01]